LISAAPPEPGQQFGVRHGPPEGAVYLVDGRGEGFTLSRDVKDLFTLTDVGRSLPPHYFPINPSGGSGSSVALAPGTATLVWPEGLGPGTFALCAESLGNDPDPCATTTIDK